MGKSMHLTAGHARMAGLKYDIIGNLDADVSFDAEYFEFLLGKFGEKSKIGCGGNALSGRIISIRLSL